VRPGRQRRSAADGLRRHARRLDAEADAAAGTAANPMLAGVGMRVS
jgi:hypothetical protein